MIISPQPTHGSLWSIVITSLIHGCIIVLALLLATLLGWIEKLDAFMAAWMGDVMDERFAHSLPSALPWLMTILIAFGLPALLLGCHHGWQRLTIWLVALVVLSLWAPVLCLSAHHPDVSLTWLAAAAAGLLVGVHFLREAHKAR